VAITLEAIHAKEVIEQAFARYGTPEIVDTDQGSQFTAVEFTDVVWRRAVSCPWTGAVPGAITYSSNGCGAA
jgi:putative transposase